MGPYLIFRSVLGSLSHTVLVLVENLNLSDVSLRTILLKAYLLITCK